MKKYPIVIFIISFITISGLLGLVVDKVSPDLTADKETYNHGICANCIKGRYEVFDTEGETHFYLKCNKCNYIVKVRSQIWLTDENYEREENK